MQLDTTTTSNACARSAERAPGFPRVILLSLTTSQVCRVPSGWDRRFQLYPRLGGRQEVTHGVSLQTALNLDPFMIHETFLYLTETAFGSHPCRVVSVTYRKLRPFHGGNRVQIPSGTHRLSNGSSRFQAKRQLRPRRDTVKIEATAAEKDWHRTTPRPIMAAAMHPCR